MPDSSEAPEPSESPMIAGKPLTFSGEDVLYLQIDGDDVIGLESHEDGSVHAFLIDSRTTVSGWINRTPIWPVHPDR